ncbi:MAG: DNA polymerase IV [Clostridia bacterium]|nr:DNA polymerase IV [Clostridia bacterium]
MKERVILHSDANCFYASCEMVLNPSLRDKAVAVGGNEAERHGIILAKSEKAKKAGVTTGMPLWEAREKCKDLIIVPPHFEIYSKFSKLLRKIYERYTDYIEPFGLDECWLDVTSCQTDGFIIAEEIRQAVKDELGLTVSIGVSFNKVFAKLGSDLKKPDATTVISKDNFKEKIWPLPVSELLFCGRQTTKTLRECGVTTIGALAKMPKDFIERRLGKNGASLWDYANGLDSSPVIHKDHYTPPKSVGHGVTCVENLINNDEASKVIVSLSLDIGYKLRKENLYANGVSLVVKDENFVSYSYQKRFEGSTQDESLLAREAISLLKSNYPWRFKIRALTITAISIETSDTPVQTDMFFDTEKEEKKKRLSSAVDSIKDTYGKSSILPATVLDEKKMPAHEADRATLPGNMKKG